MSKKRTNNIKATPMILYMNFSFIMSTVGLEFSFPKFEKINLMMSSGLPLSESCSRTSDSVFIAHILLPCQIWCLRYPRCHLFLKSRNRSLCVIFQLAASGRSHFFLSAHLQICFSFSSLSSSAWTDADSTDITWGSIRLYTAPSEGTKCFICLIYIPLSKV